MESFRIAFSNVLMILIYMSPGYVLSKFKMARAEHLSTMSTILIYVCSPCMIVSSFLSLDFSRKSLEDMAIFFVISFIMQCLFMLCIYGLFRKKYEDAKYRILTIGSVLGNVGFFGMPLIKAMLPDYPEAACYSSIYVITMNILVFTVGVYCLTQDSKYISLKVAVNNPSTYAFVLSFVIYITSSGDKLPSLISDAINLMGKMTTPFCMLILGVRLGTMSIKKLFSNGFVYFICVCKLILYPLFCFGLVYLLPISYVVKASVLILASAPSASVILNMAEIHHSEQELSANLLLLCTLLCICTIPFLVMLL